MTIVTTNGICCRMLSGFAFFLTMSATTSAADINDDDLKQLLEELQSLKAMQTRLSDRILLIEAAITNVVKQPVETTSLQAALPPTSGQMPNEHHKTGDSTAKTLPSLEVSGDFRLRYESNWGGVSIRNRDRSSLRARLRVKKPIGDNFQIGAELVTGDADDPNTDTVTISDFVNDVQVNLSQLYAQFDYGSFQITGGKFPQPFRRTDLIWDSDVNPQGISASYDLLNKTNTSLTASALYMLVDESIIGPDSAMIGGEFALTHQTTDWDYDLSAAFYDYRLSSVEGADSGDLRSNLQGDDGSYLSDFDMVNLLASVTYKGLGSSWPIRIQGDFVKNIGAVNKEDTGFNTVISAGTVDQPGNWRLSYGYMQAEVDSVFAAFSHDNFSIATNYKAHQSVLEYRLQENILLNATLFSYRPLNPVYAGTYVPDDWLQRFRLNISFNY